MDKQVLIDTIKSNLSKKIEQLDQLIEETRRSNNDTKSSMGDKYETGREMLQQEINNLMVQKNEVLKQWDVITKLNPTTTNKVGLGSLVKTSSAWFFIAVSAGTLELDGKKILSISSSAPIAIALLNKTKGDHFTFNNLEQSILEVL